VGIKNIVYFKEKKDSENFYNSSQEITQVFLQKQSAVTYLSTLADEGD
jgi:hypothetical protein